MQKPNATLPTPLNVTAGVATLFLLTILAITPGCGGTKPKSADKGFFTSGSREADQRASQRMAKSEQVAGSGEGAGERESRGAAKGQSGPEGVRAERSARLLAR